MTTLDDRLLPVFAAQHWLVGLDDVIAAGGTATHGASSRRAIRTLGRRPTSPCTDSSVRRRPGTPRLLAPILAIGGRAVASHFAAAALHGIEGFGRGTAGDLRSRRGRAPPRTTVIVHTSTDLDRCRGVVVEGIPATDVAARCSTSADASGTERCCGRSSGSRREERRTGPR